MGRSDVQHASPSYFRVDRYPPRHAARSPHQLKAKNATSEDGRAEARCHGRRQPTGAYALTNASSSNSGVLPRFRDAALQVSTMSLSFSPWHNSQMQ